MRKIVQIVLGMLQEIFEENAYRRFLARTQRAGSAESYMAFMREKEAAVVERPRCC